MSPILVNKYTANDGQAKEANMLTLTRKVGETIVIILPDGTEITVLVREIRKNQVKIGIQAPEAVTIFREEILEKNSKKEKE